MHIAHCLLTYIFILKCNNFQNGENLNSFFIRVRTLINIKAKSRTIEKDSNIINCVMKTFNTIIHKFYKT